MYINSEKTVTEEGNSYLEYKTKDLKPTYLSGTETPEIEYIPPQPVLGHELEDIEL